MSTIKHIEIAGPDGGKLNTFYSKLFNWTIQRREVGGFDYYDVLNQESPTLGIRPEPEGKPEIVLYVGVSDLDAYVEKAVALGAAVRIPPLRHGDLYFALILDPAGNPVGLMQE